MLKRTEVTLRPALAEDRFRIRRWLADADIENSWGNAASVEAEINMAMASKTALCRVVETATGPAGYAHALEIGLWADERPADLLPGTWHIGFFLRHDEAHRARDLGSAALFLLIEEVFATTLAVACSGVVPIRNEPLARTYEQAGFRWRRIWDDRLLGPAWLMLKDRPG